MEPRLKTSKKWTPLPQELVSQIRSVFKQNFKDQVGMAEIEAVGKIFPGEILVRVGIRPPESLRQFNFDVSIAYKAPKDNVLKLLHLAVDAEASLFEQYFAAENDHDFPRIWEEVQFEGRPIYIQYNTVNSQLEAEANRLLGESVGLVKGDSLIQGDWSADEETVEPDQVKASLGLVADDEDDDDDDNDSGGNRVTPRNQKSKLRH